MRGCWGRLFVKLQNCSHNFLLHFPNVFYIMILSVFMCTLYPNGKGDNMEKVLALLENIGSYLLLIRISDVLDIAIIAFLVYSLLRMVKSTARRISSRVWWPFCWCWDWRIYCS